MNLSDYPISDKSAIVVELAQSIARENSHAQYGSPHLLKAVLHKDVGLRDFLNSINNQLYFYDDWANIRIQQLPKTSTVANTIKPDKKAIAVFDKANIVKLKLNEDDITPESLLIALCSPGVGFSYEHLKSWPLSNEELLFKCKASNINISTDSLKNETTTETKTVDFSALNSFCIDKTAQFKNNELDLIYGRDAEIKTIIEILGRRLKPNVLITGEAGVGKTALLDGLCTAICKDNVPQLLNKAKIFALDYVKLVAGMAYNSVVEDRFNKVMLALKQFKKPILFIDEINNLVKKNNAYSGLVNILKDELVKSEIIIIATCSNVAFRKNIEADESLSSKFEVINLEEPKEAEAQQMILNTLTKFTDYHKLEANPKTIETAVGLAKRFIKDSALPSTAIDLIDRTMSASRYMIDTTENNLKQILDDLNKIKSDKALDEKNRVVLLEKLYDKLQNRFSYLLLTELDENNLLKNNEPSEISIQKIENILDIFSNKLKQQKTAIEPSDISATISIKTGIPVGKLQATEKDRLLNMETHLQNRVIGQDHAIKSITDATLEFRSGLSKPGIPMSFYFTGPTGTGKTELAKALAEFMFHTEEAIIRFDMSEFKEEHSAALLYGAPPGYVGYEEGGLLINKIRKKPYSVVLFDEIEKAHNSVFDTFLQILDEGKLQGRLGKSGDFSNAVVLFTSNIGSEFVVDTFNKGKIPKSNQLLELMSQHFRPEFLGRLTEIVPFAPITKQNIVKIFEIQLKDLYTALNKQEIQLILNNEVKEFLAYKGFTPKYGARPLRGVIRKELTSPLSKMIVTGKLKPDSIVSINLMDTELSWTINNKQINNT